MRVWRITILSYADKLSGMGGIYVSGRWHSIGHRIVYTSCAASLAALEYLVHVDPSMAPSDLGILQIDVPDDIDIEECDPTQLTPKWRQYYPSPEELQDFGTKWLQEKRTTVLAVPSTIMPVEKNYLINPEHKDMSRITVIDETPFSYDPRLLSH
ncbi:MAG: RES family NAD+ phosphorylase [Anaerolineaceae bacterium]|nr:RES family NAD+ phosphorylase [Anaerolineaceae bacterium]